MEETINNRNDDSTITDLQTEAAGENGEAIESTDTESIPSISLEGINGNDLEPYNLAGIACYRYSDGSSERYFSLDQKKEFSDEESLKKELKINVKPLSAEAVLKPSETEETKTVDVISQMVQVMTPHIYLKDAREYVLLSLYVILTYCYQLFNRIPYISLRGSKGSGKTTVMEILSQLVRRPKFSTNITPAALFRMIDGQRPTLLIDEVEALSSKTSGSSPIIQILNSGYQKDGKVSRVVQYETVDFTTYGPKIIAGINELSPATQERCHRITMEKSLKALVPFISTLENMTTMQSIKDAILLGIRRTAANILDYVTDKEKLEIKPEIMNRDRDLWFPILTLAKVFEHGDSKYFEQMTSLALKTIEMRKESEALQPENMAKAIIEEGIKAKKIEVTFTDKSSRYIKAKSVYELVEEKDEFNSYRTQAELTNVLKKLGIEALRRRVGGDLTTLYKLPLQFN